MSSDNAYPVSTVEGGYVTLPVPRPTPPGARPPPNPGPEPGPNPPATTDSVTTQARPPPPKAATTYASTTTDGDRQQTFGVSREPEDDSTTTTTTTSSSRGGNDGGSSPTPPPSPERATSSRGSAPGPTGVLPPTVPPGGQPTPAGDITLQPGSPTIYHNPSGAGLTPGPAISGGTVISVPMTGVVLTFAFLGALIIGLVAGFFIAKCTRLGGSSRSRRQQRDDMTEQLRLLNDALGQRNDRHFDNNPQQPPFHHDRSYFDDEKFAYAPSINQVERVPLYMNTRQSVSSATAQGGGNGSGETERLHPHSIADQNHYQDWDVATPLMSPHSNNAQPPMSFSHHAAMVSPAGPPATNRASGPEPSGAGTYLSPRVVYLPPTQLPSDVEIYGPKGEWVSMSDGGARGGGGGGGGNASRSSFASLDEFERRRPQIQEEGEGEDSLFDIGYQSHNPHVTAIME